MGNSFLALKRRKSGFDAELARLTLKETRAEAEAARFRIENGRFWPSKVDRISEATAHIEFL
jgi:hypothetical protein